MPFFGLCIGQSLSHVWGVLMAISGVFARIPTGTILFADADSNTRFAYQSVAQSAGFNVELACDGYEAIALANVACPDVLVLDTNLWGYDGFEVIRQLRASPRTRAMPIVIVSAEDGAEFEAAVRGSGCDANLTKPCSAKALLRLVEVLLIRRRSAARAVAASVGAA